jgi:hypothetical protein
MDIPETFLNFVRPVLYTTGHIGLRAVAHDGTLAGPIGDPHRPVTMQAQSGVALSLYRTAPRYALAGALFGFNSEDQAHPLAQGMVEDYLAALDGHPVGHDTISQVGGRDRARILAGPRKW